jgi:hypothetical protein
MYAFFNTTCTALAQPVVQLYAFFNTTCTTLAQPVVQFYAFFNTTCTALAQPVVQFYAFFNTTCTALAQPVVQFVECLTADQMIDVWRIACFSVHHKKGLFWWCRVFTSFLSHFPYMFIHYVLMNTLECAVES